MVRAAKSILLSVLVLAGLGAFMMMTSSSSVAHNPDDCYGWSTLDVAWGLGYEYSTQSRCDTAWDIITATAVLVRFESGQPILDSIMEIDVDFFDDDAGVTGIVVLRESRCYINVGVHSAHEVHFTRFHTTN